MIICGIDPGIATTGWGVIEEHRNGRCTVLGQGAIHTSAQTAMTRRLKMIHDAVRSLLDRHRPDVLAIEQIFFIRNTSARVGVSQSRGVVLLAAEEYGIAAAEYAPKAIKLAVTGYGGADKSQVSLMVTKILGLPAVPRPADVADALAAALCHAQSYRCRAIQGTV